MVGAISFTNIQKIFPAQDDQQAAVEALSHINASIEPGQFVSLVGPSGSGKTTLLRIIAGLEKPTTGEVLIDQERVTQPSRKKGFVFQEATLYPWLTVYDNIALGLRLNKEEKRLNEVNDYIKLVGLEGFEKAFPHNLSGGMQQRVNIARALINKPDVLLLDEPFGALDAFTRSKMQNDLIAIWKERQITMVMVTHDVEEAVFLSDRIFAMTPRPAIIKEVIPVHLERPRLRDAPEFIAIKEQVLSVLNF
ncbi:ABC transporter ATP-binding protein [Streptococcus ferus]|uniref:ABC-type quaternary amine transporter n=1 Tax=Streptococcus ferus TaxID=1345 RepID=A0A2X3VT09_9STRE|nr:ABC transporter ATP-binding protein [Streptococcus ferus]SQF40855.1 ABC transporter ATP-binding protein [Streptococcus ferus]